MMRGFGHLCSKYMFTTLVEQIQSQSILDWIVMVTGIIYVIYAARNNPICWVWGIISCGLLGYLSATKYSLFADAALQAFYVVMGCIGLWNWKRGANQPDLPITNISSKELAAAIVLGLLGSYIIHTLLANHTQAAATGLDALTTAFSIIATFWLVQRRLENWMLWVIVDIIYIYLYWSRGAFLFALLMLIYTIVAIDGWRRWRRMA